MRSVLTGKSGLVCCKTTFFLFLFELVLEKITDYKMSRILFVVVLGSNLRRLPSSPVYPISRTRPIASRSHLS